MVVGGHVVLFPAYGVGDAVVQDIYQNKEIRTADRIVDNPLSFPGSEARTLDVDQIAVFTVAGQGKLGEIIKRRIVPVLDQITVHLRGKFPAAFQRGDFQRALRNRVFLNILWHCALHMG